MPKCEECTVFIPTLLICPTTGMLVKADTYASTCEMKLPRCGDCSIFIPNLFNCTEARIADKPVGIQVTPSTFSCEAFMPKEK